MLYRCTWGDHGCEIVVNRQAHMMPVQRKAAGEADRGNEFCSIMKIAATRLQV